MQTGKWISGVKQPRRDTTMDVELGRKKEEQVTLQKELIDRKHKKMLLEQYIIKQDKELETLTGWIRSNYENYRGRENEILPSRVIERAVSPIKIISTKETKQTVDKLVKPLREEKKGKAKKAEETKLPKKPKAKNIVTAVDAVVTSDQRPKNGDNSTNEITAKYCDPPILKDDTGKRNGCRIADALTFELDKVDNLYEYRNRVFKFFYTENDVSCDQGNPSLAVTECEVDRPLNPRPRVTFDNNPFVEWGINYLGKIVIEHPDHQKFSIRMIGEWSYDPAGVTKSAHASERIGGDCFSMQIGVTVAQVVAFLKGCPEDFIYEIQRETLPTIMKYHERFFLHEWMGLQVIAACYYKRDATPYPEYLIEKVKSGELRLDHNNRTHTIEYLDKWIALKTNQIQIHEFCPPGAFYAKMIDTRKGEYQSLAQIGDQLASQIIAKGSNVNYDLSRINAPNMKSVCSYLSVAIEKILSNQAYKQSDLHAELASSEDAMNERLGSLIKTYKNPSKSPNENPVMMESDITPQRLENQPARFEGEHSDEFMHKPGSNYGTASHDTQERLNSLHDAHTFNEFVEQCHAKLKKAGVNVSDDIKKIKDTFTIFMGFEPLKYLENVTGGMGENELEKTLDIMMDLGNDLRIQEEQMLRLADNIRQLRHKFQLT